MIDVECHHTDCTESTTIPETIEHDTEHDAEGWIITMAYDGDEWFDIVRAYCPEHTVEKYIDDLAAQVESFTESFKETQRVARTLRES